VDRFAFDARWKYAAGGLDFDHPSFVHTVLVDMRARLAASQWPDRVFEVTVEAAKAAGLVGRKRVLDSTPLYDAVATMDTVTLIRSAIRGLLKAADPALRIRLRAGLVRDDDYATAGKPVCDWDDAAGRVALVDALAKDAMAALTVLDGQELEPSVAQAAGLLATVVGQDLDEDDDGVFRIARRVAKDRVISTVDPQARHGHKTAARGFDGYKGHIGIDPDSEIITATVVTPGNSGDAEPVNDLLAEDLPAAPREPNHHDSHSDDNDDSAGGGESDSGDPQGEVCQGGAGSGLAVYGDAAYGSGAVVRRLEQTGTTVMVKVQPPTAPHGRFTKDRFVIDTAAAVVCCPAGASAVIRPGSNGGGTARFGAVCATCPLMEQCTASTAGRTIKTSRWEAELTRALSTQTDPAWRAEYRATRPKVERKIGHLMRRKHGGRRARVRGTDKVAADFTLLAAAANLARLAILGLTRTRTGWATATA